MTRPAEPSIRSPLAYDDEQLPRDRSSWGAIVAGVVAAFVVMLVLQVLMLWLGLQRIAITFNDDVNEDLINLHHHRTPFRVIPELVKDYALEARVGGAWRAVARVADNRVRRRVHDVDLDGVTELRLRVLDTNGSAYAEVVEVRAYAERDG